MPERIVTDEDWESLFSQIKESGMPQYGITIGDGVNAAETWYPQAEALGNRTTLSCGVVLGKYYYNRYRPTDVQQKQSANTV